MGVPDRFPDGRGLTGPPELTVPATDPGPSPPSNAPACTPPPRGQRRLATLRRCTDKRKVIVEFYLYLAAALVVIRRLINQARSRYRWPTRATTRRLR